MSEPEKYPIVQRTDACPVCECRDVRVSTSGPIGPDPLRVRFCGNRACLYRWQARDNPEREEGR